MLACDVDKNVQLNRDLSCEAIAFYPTKAFCVAYNFIFSEDSERLFQLSSWKDGINRGCIPSLQSLSNVSLMPKL